MQTFWRGALIAPISAPLITYAGVSVLNLADGTFEWGGPDGAAMILGLGLMFSYSAMFLLGLP